MQSFLLIMTSNYSFTGDSAKSSFYICPAVTSHCCGDTRIIFDPSVYLVFQCDSFPLVFIDRELRRCLTAQYIVFLAFLQQYSLSGRWISPAMSKSSQRPILLGHFKPYSDSLSLPWHTINSKAEEDWRQYADMRRIHQP